MERKYPMKEWVKLSLTSICSSWKLCTILAIIAQKNGLPLTIVSDWDKLFMSKLWCTLHAHTCVKLKMSTAYFSETEGSSEQTNKTIVQALSYHVTHNQTGWVYTLPHVQFDLMNILNHSTIFTPFQLHLGHFPCLLPPLIPSTIFNNDEDTVEALI